MLGEVKQRAKTKKRRRTKISKKNLKKKKEKEKKRKKKNLWWKLLQDPPSFETWWLWKGNYVAEKFLEILKLRVTGLNTFESYFAQIYFSDHPSEKLIPIFSGIK